jgi:hypothetical protein
MLMKNGWLQMWLRSVLAVSALGAGPVWAGSAHGRPEQALVLPSPGAGETRLQVASTQGIEPGSWVLVQVAEDEASWPRELMQVWAADTQGLELGRPLLGIPRVTDAQVSLLWVEQQSRGDASPRLDRPRQGAEVPGGELRVEGQAPRGSQVLVFIDGVESAALEVDDSGRFEGAIEAPLSPGHHQVRVVSGLEGVWSLDSEPVTVVSLAPPPDPVVLEPAAGAFTNDTTPLFRGTAQAGATVIVSIALTDVASVIVDSTGNWSLSLPTPLADGSYSSSIRVQATNGESSGSVFVNFRVDTSPPHVNIIEEPPAYTSSRSVSVRFMNSESGVVECVLDGVSIARPCFPPFETSGLTEGPHVLVLNSTDRAGNVDPAPATVRWVVDFTPPTLLFRSGPPTWSRVTSSSFMVEASEEITLYECALDGAAWSTCSATPTVSGLAEGAHTLAVRGTDRAAQVSPTVSYGWNVDLTAPLTPVLLQPVADALLRVPTPEISGTAESGSTVRVLIEGLVACTTTAEASRSWKCQPNSPLVTNTASNPTYELVLEAQDAAGNVSGQSVPVSFRVDVDRPDTLIVEGPGPVLREQERPRFVFQSTEEGVRYVCRVNQEPEGSCDELVNGSRSFAPGEYTVVVYAIDEAGNQDDSPATRTWTNTIYEGAGGGCSVAGGSALFPLGALLVLLRRRRSRSSSRETAGLGGLLAMLLVLLVGPAQAQGFDLQRYRPAPGVRDVLGVYSPEVPRDNIGLHLGLSATYAKDPLILRLAGDGSRVQSIISDQFTAEFLASVWFSRHFELGLALPLTIQGGTVPDDLAVFVPENVTGTGLGDMRVVPKLVLPLGDKWSLGAAGVLSVPTGDAGGFRGSSGVGGQVMGLLQWAPSKQVKVLANVGARFQPDTRVELLDLRAGNELTYALGAQWSPAESGFFVQANVQGAVALNEQPNAGRPLEVLLAGGYAFSEGLRVRGGLGGGVSDGYGTPSFRGLASVDWSTEKPQSLCICTGEPNKDDDEDTISNGIDVCPYLKGAAGGNGCPRDGSAEDLIGQLVLGFRADSDGDGDGIRDNDDACPTTSGVKEYNGCPVSDTDRDGIPDHQDKCYSHPETRNDFLEEDGCPDEVDTVDVQFSFKNGGNTVEQASLSALEARLGRLSAQERLEEVSASLPNGPNWMAAARLPSVNSYLTKQLQRILAVAKRTEKPKVLVVDDKGRKVTAAKTDPLTLTLTLRINSGLRDEWKPPAPKCLEKGVAARQLWPAVGEDAGLHCDEAVVSADAGAVLVMSDSSVLRLAPGSQLKLSKNKGQSQVQNGAVEVPGSEAALDAPEVFGPCGKCSPYGVPTTLSWKTVPGAQRYWVQVSRGVGFASELRSDLTESTQSTLKLEGGTWFWRVLPVDSKGLTGKPSKIHSFEVKQ